MSATTYEVRLSVLRAGGYIPVVVLGHADGGAVVIEESRWPLDIKRPRLTDHERAAAVSLIRAQHFAEGK